MPYYKIKYSAVWHGTKYSNMPNGLFADNEKKARELFNKKYPYYKITEIKKED